MSTKDVAIYKYSYNRNKAKDSLEVLRNARVPLLREDARVLNPCVPSCAHISYYRLLVSARIRIVVAVRPGLVVALVVVVVIVWITGRHTGILARVVGAIGG